MSRRKEQPIKETRLVFTVLPWPNFKLHPLSLVKVQFSPLSFDRFNLVIKVWFDFNVVL
jgi:hypothetical protein